MKNAMKKTNETINRLKLWLQVNYYKAVMMMYALFCPISVAFAEDEAKAKWDSVIDFITPWIQRLGGVVILIGAVEFGLAWKNDDAEAKTKGMRAVIAGCIVFAVGLSSSTFLA